MRIFWDRDHDQPSKTETHNIKQLKTRIFWDGDHAGRPGKTKRAKLSNLKRVFCGAVTIIKQFRRRFSAFDLGW